MPLKQIVFVVGFAICAGVATAQNISTDAALDTYLQQYVRTQNFAGDILIKKDGKVLFEKAYGFADREHHVPNTLATRFHIASMSMQFTAAAVLRLVDTGAIKLDDHVGAFIPGIDGADKITVRDLLTERSALPDINALPGYDDILQHHQTPASLIGKIEGQSLLFEPGSKFLHEEHSAYNLLAFIVEKKTGIPFARAIEKLVFRPMRLTSSGIDDDSPAHAALMARGYAPEGTFGLKPAPSIHWSGKTGNASVYTTASDEARWVDELFRGNALSASSREAALDTSQRVGYGWFKGNDKRFGQTTYSMNGRAPGFSSFVLYLPDKRTTIVVLSNIYSSATTTIGNDLAAITLGLPYEPLHFRQPAPDAAELKSCTGTFRFGADFFQPNADVTLTANDSELLMHWPSGEVSALVPFTKDHFVDRSYWEDVTLERDSSGHAVVLHYDRFQGLAKDSQDRR